VRPPRGFPLIRVVLLAALLIVGLLFRGPIVSFFSGGGSEVRVGLALRVVPGQAQAGDVAANGYIVADRQASLATVLSGRLVELNVKEGDIVEKDQVVARIQFDDYAVEVERAEAALASSRARHEQARGASRTAAARVEEASSNVRAAELTSARLSAEKDAQRELESQAKENVERLEREVRRNASLHEQKLIDAAEWDRIQTEARSARMLLLSAEARTSALDAAEKAWTGQIRAREAALAVARTEEAAAKQGETVAASAVDEATQSAAFARIQLDKTNIRAPFRGMVIRKDAEKGEVLAPMGAGNSRGSVATIVDPSSLEVQVELSERRIAKVREGDQASVFLNAEPDKRLAGRVRKIWPRAERSTGSIEVRVVLDEPPAVLRPDMAARVVFSGAEEAVDPGPAYVSVPADAVVRRGGQSVVFVVSAGTVRLVQVALGAPRGTSVEVTSGLSGGETVVLAPSVDLVDGAAVRVPE
jgi:RND family efflux transporter MFP subunit